MSIPVLSEYGISPNTGFLPESGCLSRLPSAFSAWEDIAAELPQLIKAQQIQTKINAMPLLSAGKLRSVSEYRRAYSILAFMAHAYVWSGPSPNDHLPNQLSVPLVATSNELGLPPLATFASLCLWNFSCPESHFSKWTLDNLQSITTYTGSYDETWFYIVSVELEKIGGPCLLHGLGAITAAHNDEPSKMINHLNQLAEDIDKLSVVMMRLYENLSPEFFYNTLRPFLAGWKGMEESGLPDGVYYGDDKDPKKFSGGSNGQSSLIQALDIILNVEHHATGQRTPEAPAKPTSKNGFLMEMRNYMPREHREFLFELEKCSNTREYVTMRSGDVPELGEAYDNCLKVLRDFRSKHIQIVMRYISLRSKNPSQAQGIGLAKSSGDVGTGGTQLMPFLKQTRDEVADSATGKWAHSIVTRSKSVLEKPAEQQQQEEENKKRL